MFIILSNLFLYIARLKNKNFVRKSKKEKKKMIVLVPEARFTMPTILQHGHAHISAQ